MFSGRKTTSGKLKKQVFSVFSFILLNWGMKILFWLVLYFWIMFIQSLNMQLTRRYPMVLKVRKSFSTVSQDGQIEKDK